MVDSYQSDVRQKRSISNSIKILRNGVAVSGKHIAQVLNINTYFLRVNDDLPRLDISSLLTYLSVPEIVPSLTSEEVCTKMLKLKVAKSNGPDNIPNRIIRDLLTKWQILFAIFLSPP